MAFDTRLQPRWAASPRMLTVGLTLAIVCFVLLSASETSRSLVWNKVRWQYASEPPDKKVTTLEELRELVGREPQFLVRDGHAALGWNNQRYLLDTTLLLGRLLNRVPVIPDAIWARSCVAKDEKDCDDNSLDAWRNPNDHEDNDGVRWNGDSTVWKLPIQEFLDLEHLRSSYGPVLTGREFLDLHDMQNTPWPPSGHFNKDTLVPKQLTLQVMTSAEFETPPQVRVDAIVRQLVGDPAPTFLNETFVRQAMGPSRRLWSIEEAREAFRQAGLLEHHRISEAEIDRALIRAGVTRLYTFDDVVLMNKAVIAPSTEYTYTSNLVPLVTDRRAKWPNTLLYQSGQIHDQRKPGALRFTSARQRREFIETAVHSIRAPKPIIDLSETIATRMSRRVGGRSWLAAHMRRGDFVQIAWATEQDSDAHMNKTLEALKVGREKLSTHVSNGAAPLPSDPFFLATDESDPAQLDRFRASGAVLLVDLLTDADRKSLGWQANFGDLLALVSQGVLARSSYFVGSGMSSLSGGALNQRMRLEQPDWSWALLFK